MESLSIEVGLFNGLTLVAREVGESALPRAIFPEQNIGSGKQVLVVWLTPYNKPGFDDEALTRSCANNLDELVRELVPVIGPTVRRTVLSEFWPGSPPHLRWHMAIHELKSGPVIELLVATRWVMRILTSGLLCKKSAVFK